MYEMKLTGNIEIMEQKRVPVFLRPTELALIEASQRKIGYQPYAAEHRQPLFSLAMPYNISFISFYRTTSLITDSKYTYVTINGL